MPVDWMLPPSTMIQMANKASNLARIREIVERGTRFLITSHARPDGDAIGSQVALAYALRYLGKEVRLVNHDPPPPHYMAFPGVMEIEIATSVEGTFDATFVLECGDLERPGVAGLDRTTVINIDHHAGNTLYGQVNWLDETASACGEMVFDIVETLGVPLTREIATHVYIAILADTGSFRHSTITPRTFEICRRATQAGVDAVAVAKSVFDTSSVGKLKLTGSLLDTMQIEGSGRLAVLFLNDDMLMSAGCTYGETEGIINLPLAARDIQAVIFFKYVDGELRVSLRSKGDVDVRAVARQHGGGGHVNASAFSAKGNLAETRTAVIAEVIEAIDRV